MTALTVREIAIFANRHSVPTAHVYTLPVIFEKIATVANQPIRAIIRKATYSDMELAAYIKELAAEVA